MGLKFTPKLYVVRNYYGLVTQATFLSHSIAIASLASDQKYQTYNVKTTKDLVQVMLQSGTHTLLFNAAWRDAVRDGAVDPCRPLSVDDGEQSIEYAKQEAFQVDAYISQRVNDPQSKFYIYG